MLTSEQQDGLRALIQDWVEKNPDQAYVWEIRLSGFSGQRAQELERVAASGGLLAEAQRARETVNEVRVLAVFEGNQINRLMDDLHRTSLAVEQFGLLAKQLPGEREAAIGQLAKEVTREREAGREDR